MPVWWCYAMLVGVMQCLLVLRNAWRCHKAVGRAAAMAAPLFDYYQ